MYYVYLLKLNNGTHYTGFTTNLKNRVRKHNSGGVLATKGNRPVHLAFYCAFPTKPLAIAFEAYLKSGSGQAFRNRHFT
ncbi:MAG: GIY-YIG nuclease family protein [Patescibacteria group bacterium]